MSANMIPIFTSLFFWAFIAAIILVPMYLRQKARVQAHETIRAMIAHGKDVTAEQIAALQAGAKEDERGPPGRRAHAAGIIVIAVGLGALVFAGALAYALWWNHEYEGASIAGSVIAAAGVGVMIVGAALMYVGRQAMRAQKS